MSIPYLLQDGCNYEGYPQLIWALFWVRGVWLGLVLGSMKAAARAVVGVFALALAVETAVEFQPVDNGRLDGRSAGKCIPYQTGRSYIKEVVVSVHMPTYIYLYTHKCVYL